MYFIVPIIGLTNWILLLRATSFLSRVLRSHLMDIKLYSNNRAFYNTQLSAYNFYRKFRIMCLVSALFSIVSFTGFLVIRMVKIVLVSFCNIHFGHTMIPLFLRGNQYEVDTFDRKYKMIGFFHQLNTLFSDRHRKLQRNTFGWSKQMIKYC